MSFIQGVPRVCFENLIVKDHGLFLCTAEFRKGVVFKGSATFATICGNIETDSIKQKTGTSGISIEPKILVD